jgi:hypothetical protein
MPLSGPPASEELRWVREEFGLTKQKMMDLLWQHRFLAGLNWGVYYGWERGAVHLRLPYEDAIREILTQERTERTDESKRRRGKADGHDD